jgi:TRAP transporter TAXI family solute receptor
MRRHRAFLTAICLLLAATSWGSPALAQPFGITTGEPTGTYHAVARDIRDLAAPAGIAINVLDSRGSLENMYRVFEAPEAQLGIVQHDVLFWIRSNRGSDIARRMAERIKLVHPLYNEEVHVLARQDSGITGLADLAGRRVAAGPEGSGTRLTAAVLFDLTGIRPAELVGGSAADALARLKRGEVDAMIYVAGAPVQLFMDSVTAADGLRLVAVDDGDVTAFYGSPRALGPVQYPWAEEAVRSVAARAVLVTYDYQASPDKCAWVGRIAELVRTNLAELRRTGHPKWRDVDLAADVYGWDRAPCAAPPPQGNQGGDEPAFRQFLDEMRRDLEQR